MLPEQQEMFDIDSPCVGICEVNNKGFCKGCFRNRNERLYWHTFSTEQRGILLTILSKRRAIVQANKKAKITEEDIHTDNLQGDLFS